MSKRAREIVCFHVGGAGIRTGKAAWELFCTDGRIAEDGMRSNGVDNDDNNIKNDSFFHETRQGYYQPRCLFVDCEDLCTVLKRGKYTKLFDSERVILNTKDTTSTYPRAQYNISGEEIVKLRDKVLHLTEECDHLHGFIVTHSIAGGTGSGITAKLMEILSDDYSTISRSNISIFSAPRSRSYATQNELLGLGDLICNSDLVVPVSNSAIRGMCQRELHIVDPTWRNMNSIIAQMISSLTHSLRFQDTLNIDLFEFQTLNPYPRMHFVIPSLSPIATQRKATLNENIYPTFYELATNVFDSRNCLVQCNLSAARMMKIMLMCECPKNKLKEAVQKLKTAVASVKQKRTVSFVDWAPNNIKVGISSHAKSERVLMLSNSTATVDLLSPILHRFKDIFQQSPHLFWYYGDSVNWEEFQSVFSDVQALQQDYVEVAARRGAQ